MASGKTGTPIYTLLDCDARAIRQILRSVRKPGEVIFRIRRSVPLERVKRMLERLFLERSRLGDSWLLEHRPGDDYLLRFRSRGFSPADGVDVILSNTSERAPRTEASVVTTEPRVAKGIASLLLPRKHRTTFLGDLYERYSSVEREQGSRSARWWYWKEVTKEALPSLWRLCVWPALRRLVSEAVKQLIGG